MKMKRHVRGSACVFFVTLLQDIVHSVDARASHPDADTVEAHTGPIAHTEHVDEEASPLTMLLACPSRRFPLRAISCAID